MLGKLLLSSALALLMGGPVWAADAGTTGMKLEEAVRPKKFEEDKRITDNELKAQAGSLSRYSLKFDLSFAGPPVDNLSDPSMPNPDGRARPSRTVLSGYPALRYRFNSNSALNMSTGVRWYAPYQQITGAETEKPKGEKDYAIANPQISYDRTYPFYATQMRSSFKGSYITEDYYQLRGEWAGLGYTQGVKYTPGQGRVILGLALDFDYYLFNRDYQAKWPGQKSGDGKVSNYYLTYIPSLEYKLMDKLNFKTSVGWSYSNQRSTGNFREWQEVEPTGRAGLGWSVTREVYFYPYVSFYTKRPSISTSNVAFSTVFSIF